MTKQEKDKIISELAIIRGKENIASNFDNRVYQAYQNCIDYIDRFVSDDDDLK